MFINDEGVEVEYTDYTPSVHACQRNVIKNCTVCIYK